MVNGAIKWIGERQFVGFGKKSGHSLVLDLAPESGGNNMGMRPTELFLLGIAGCTAVDVVDILQKMKSNLTRCEIEIEGEQMEDYPKYFRTIKLKYTLSGEGLDKQKAEKAVGLSMDKYCSVSQSVKGRAEFLIEIEIV